MSFFMKDPIKLHQIRWWPPMHLQMCRYSLVFKARLRLGHSRFLFLFLLSLNCYQPSCPCCWILITWCCCHYVSQSGMVLARWCAGSPISAQDFWSSFRLLISLSLLLISLSLPIFPGWPTLGILCQTSTISKLLRSLWSLKHKEKFALEIGLYPCLDLCFAKIWSEIHRLFLGLQGLCPNSAV